MAPVPKKQPPQNQNQNHGVPTPSPHKSAVPIPNSIVVSQPVKLPAPILPSPKENHRHVIQVVMIGMACMVGVLMFLCTVSVVIKYFYSRRYRRNNHNRTRTPILFDVNGNSPTWDDDDDDQDQVAVLHPIWYIRTEGLQQSLIDSITVFKYRKHEGIVEGTDCSVCLGEFQHDESLRLLPKCSHAFHIPCIDTWLRSHKNCPLCRAPVAHDAAQIRAVDSNVSDHHPSQTPQVENSDRESGEVRIEVSPTQQRLRRSVSVDDLSSANSTVNFGDVEVDLDTRFGEKLNSSVSKYGSGSSTAIHKVASIGRALQKRRSFSHNRKFLLSTHCRSQSSSLPL